METVIRYLPRAVDAGHDIVARERLMVASSYGGWMLVDGLVHIGHCISHQIGSAFHIPHGAACAYAFPAMAHHIALVSSDKIRYVGELLGVKFNGTEGYQEIADRTIEAFLHFRDYIIKLRPLSDYNPDLSKVNLSMAEAILADPITALTPAPVTLEDVCYMLYTTFIS
jgi:alcohol dehydrogenase